MEPSAVWSICESGEWATGGTKNDNTASKLSPLQVGSKATFSPLYYNSIGFTASNGSSKKCKVESADIGGATVDAFKVVCSQNYGDKLGGPFGFPLIKGLVRYDTGAGSKTTRRLVRVL